MGTAHCAIGDHFTHETTDTKRRGKSCAVVVKHVSDDGAQITVVLANAPTSDGLS